MDIDKLLKTGRQTLYSLFGAGLHGRNGLNPPISKHIWCTYVVPRFIYGVEIQNLTDQQLQQLSHFQTKSLKQLQWLPERCSTAAVYLLLGAETIEALIHKKMIGFFGQITRDKDSLENQIAYRQIAIYDLNSKSWFSRLKVVLAKYNLPSALHLLEHPMKKEHFKKMVDDKIDGFWLNKLIQDKNSKTSLNMMSVSQLKIGVCHPVWKTVRNNPKDVEKAAIKARILTGTYTLQANRAKFNQYEVDPTCPLCQKGSENRKHFILLCPVTEAARVKFLLKIINIISTSTVTNVDVQDDDILLQLIVDCSALIIGTQYNSLRYDIETLSRELIYSIHVLRTRLVTTMHMPG